VCQEKFYGHAGKSLSLRVLLLVMSADAIQLRQPLIRYLTCLGLNTDDAHDVAQEAFLRLHRHVSEGGPDENLRSWLFRVAHNEACNRQRSYERRNSAPLDSVDPPDSADPERTLLKKEKFRRLDTAMKALPAQDREAILLRAEGLRYREIGDVLGLATSTVADIIDRAIRKLAENCK
jgi:RNA polymerase sigma-70 factor, ECF subfamily